MFWFLKHAFSLVILFSFASPGASVAAPTGLGDDCSERDLNASPQSPFRNIPVYDQDGTGTCYAHAAAELVDYYLLSHGGKASDLVHPMYAAWVNSYQAAWIKSGSLNGGQIGDVISGLRIQGYCKNDRVQECLSEFKKIGKMTDVEVIRFLAVLYDNYTVFTNENSVKRTVRLTAQDYWLSGCRVQELSVVMQAKNLMNVAQTEVLAELFKKCQPPNSLSQIPKPQVYEDWKDQEIQGRIDQALNDQTPVAVGMCSRFFDVPSYRGLIGDSGFLSFMLQRGSNGNMKSDCGGHAVLISGRKIISGECRYLIRNSWGAQWHPVGIDCACINSQGDYEAVCGSPNPQEFVGCWYRGKDLIPNVTDVTTL